MKTKKKTNQEEQQVSLQFLTRIRLTEERTTRPLIKKYHGDLLPRDFGLKILAAVQLVACQTDAAPLVYINSPSIYRFPFFFLKILSWHRPASGVRIRFNISHVCTTTTTTTSVLPFSFEVCF